MDDTLKRLKENFGDSVILSNLEPVEKYYFGKGLDKNYVSNKLSHLVLCDGISRENLMELSTTFCPILDIDLSNIDGFMNDLMKMLSMAKEAYPNDIRIGDGNIAISSASDAVDYVTSGLNALNENYEAEEKLEENSQLDKIVDKDMDDMDVQLVYSLGKGSAVSNMDDARQWIKDEIQNNPSGKVARVLSSSFLKDYTLREAMDQEVPMPILEKTQKDGIALYESKGTINKVSRHGKSYRITKFKK